MEEASIVNSTLSSAIMSRPTPWLLSTELKLTIQYALRLIILSICIFGFASNAVNIYLFYKTGLKTSTNICFFSLAIADMTFVSWIFLLFLRPFVDKPTALISWEVLVTTIWSQIAYAASAFGSWVTMVVSLERCCCIVIPMKVKQVFTPKSVTAMMLVMVTYEVAAVTPYYFAFTILKVTLPLNNKTRLILDRVTYNRDLANLSKLVVYSVPTSVCFFLVILATIFLILNFKKSLKVRKTMTGKEKGSKDSARDARVMKTVLYICVVYIAGSFVTVGKFLAAMIYPTIHYRDPILGNFTVILTSFGFLFQTLSCSLNIFVYIKMNAGFRRLALDMLKIRSKKKC